MNVPVLNLQRYEIILNEPKIFCLSKVSKEPFDMQLEISKLLNRLAQFECLEDFLAVKDSEDKNRWKSMEVTDKICELADIIKLYKKYREVNPATGIVRDMEELIVGRLKKSMQA